MSNRPREGVPAPPIMAALEMVQQFPDDIRTLRQAGITQAELQRVTGPHRLSLRRYEQGTHLPRDPVVFVVIVLWAREVRRWLHGCNAPDGERTV